MEIAIIQHDIYWASPEKNAKHLECLLEQHPEADLFVL